MEDLEQIGVSLPERRRFVRKRPMSSRPGRGSSAASTPLPRKIIGMGEQETLVMLKTNGVTPLVMPADGSKTTMLDSEIEIVE
jgi:hypothetical protein